MTDTLKNILHLNRRGVISIIGAGGKTSLMFRLAKELSDSGKTVLATTTTKIFMPDKDVSPHTTITGSIDELVLNSETLFKRYPYFSAGSEHDVTTGKLNGFGPDAIKQLWQSAVFDWIIVEADGAKRLPLKSTGTHEPVIPEVTTHLILVTGLDAVNTPLDDKHVHRAALFSKNTGLPVGEPITEPFIATSIAIELKKAEKLSYPSSTAVILNKADTQTRRTSGQKIAGFLKTNQSINQIIIASLKAQTAVKDFFILQKTIKDKRET